MPINPISVENPYGLPPLDPAQGPPPYDPKEQMRQDLIRQANEISQGRPGASLSAFSLADAVPMSEWKPPEERVRLPMSQRQHASTVIQSYNQQLHTLQRYASDPRNPVSQEEVGRIRQQLDHEVQRALTEGTMPTPVSMYETLLEGESPEIKQAKIRDSWKSIPGFKEEWGSFVTFDPQTNEPVYPKWMEKPMELSMSKAMGVAEEEEDPAIEAANEFQLEQLERREPKASDYEQGAANPEYVKAREAWDKERYALFVRTNPDAAKRLPTFAEERGFAQPAAPSAEPAMPMFDEEETSQLQARFEANGVNTTVAKTLEDLQEQMSSGTISPDDVVIVSTPNGAIAVKLESNGQFRQVGRFSNRQ